MKKLFTILLVAMLVFSLSACSFFPSKEQNPPIKNEVSQEDIAEQEQQNVPDIEKQDVTDYGLQLGNGTVILPITLGELLETTGFTFKESEKTNDIVTSTDYFSQYTLTDGNSLITVMLEDVDVDTPVRDCMVEVIYITKVREWNKGETRWTNASVNGISMGDTIALDELRNMCDEVESDSLSGYLDCGIIQREAPNGYLSTYEIVVSEGVVEEIRYSHDSHQTYSTWKALH